jgi:hypothetical protein
VTWIAKIERKSETNSQKETERGIAGSVVAMGGGVEGNLYN